MKLQAKNITKKSVILSLLLMIIVGAGYYSICSTFIKFEPNPRFGPEGTFCISHDNTLLRVNDTYGSSWTGIIFLSETDGVSLFEIMSEDRDETETYQVEVRKENGLYVAKIRTGSGPGRGQLPLEIVKEAGEWFSVDSSVVHRLLNEDYSKTGYIVPWKGI